MQSSFRFPLPSSHSSRQRRVRACARLAIGAVLALLASPVASGQSGYCESDGLIVAQVESAGPVAGWTVETTLPGYTGASYLRWTGGNQFNTPGQGILTYTLNVTTPGIWNMRLRNLHNHPDPTLENDCWARMDGGSWIKVYSPNISPDWNWASWFDPGNVLTSYALTAGVHTFQLSGRSNNFRIDRVHFFLTGTQAPQGLFHPESLCAQTWTGLGQGKPGTGGLVPALTGTGTLNPGALTALNLAQAKAQAAATLVIGFGLLGAPFKGGVLVPQADIVIGGLPTSPGGALVISANWPAGIPGGTSLYFQYWIADAGASFGLSASNGLQATTP